MTRYSRKLEQLERLYRAQHDIDVLTELRRMRQKAGLFATFKGQVIHQDQLDALENIARQYGEAVEDVVDTIGHPSARTNEMIEYLKLKTKNGRAKSLIIPQALTHLTSFYCMKNNLVSLKILPGMVLQSLGCGENQLTELHIPPGTPLEFLFCDNNQLTTISIPPGTPLKELECRGNKLVQLTVPPGTPIYDLCAQRNPLKVVNIPRKHYEALLLPPNCQINYHD